MGTSVRVSSRVGVSIQLVGIQHCQNDSTANGNVGNQNFVKQSIERKPIAYKHILSLNINRGKQKFSIITYRVSIFFLQSRSPLTSFITSKNIVNA